MSSSPFILNVNHLHYLKKGHHEYFLNKYNISHKFPQNSEAQSNAIYVKRHCNILCYTTFKTNISQIQQCKYYLPVNKRVFHQNVLLFLQNYF